MLFAALLLMQSALPPQIERGQALFMDGAKGCASCHALKGRGTAVGPDLKLAASLAPRAIVTMMRATLTQSVQTVKLKTGEPFPAMPGAKNGTSVELYDLSKMPPELRKVEQSDIESSKNNETWRHPPLTRGYTAAELADIIAYVKYAGNGDKKKIDPEDVK
jgi:mono/diheme cytochrome c family protein